MAGTGYSLRDDLNYMRGILDERAARDPQLAASERQARENLEYILSAKPKRPVSAMPKFMSTQDAINRRVGFVVMDYG